MMLLIDYKTMVCKYKKVEIKKWNNKQKVYLNLSYKQNKWMLIRK